MTLTSSTGERRDRSTKNLLRLDRLAVGVAASTFALMTVGSVVHGTGSSLACPDWPLCHGTAFPSMRGGVQFEHTHRLVAALVVALTLLLTVFVWRHAGRAERRLAGLACVLVAVQAALGAATVLLRLPPAVSIAHLLTSMTFFGVVIALAARLSGLARRETDARARAWFTLAIGVVLCQVVLGGVVRHTGAALACAGIPLCDGEAWPAAALAEVQMVHRAAAVVASCVVIGAVAVRLRGRRAGDAFGRLAFLPAALVLAQLTLGVAVVLGGASLELTTAHHAIGALLVGSLVLARAGS